jgi:Tfp pilus assembly protein PilF
MDSADKVEDSSNSTEFKDELIRKLFERLCPGQKHVISVADVKSRLDSMVAGPVPSSVSNPEVDPTGGRDTSVSVKQWIQQQKTRRRQPGTPAAAVVSWDTKVAQPAGAEAADERQGPEQGGAAAPTRASLDELQGGEEEQAPRCGDAVRDDLADQADQASAADKRPALQLSGPLSEPASKPEAAPAADAGPQPPAPGSPLTAEPADAADRYAATPPKPSRPDAVPARSETAGDAPEVATGLAAARALARGDYDAARRACDAVIQAGGAPFSAFYVRAESYRLLGRPAAAADDLAFCLAMDPASARAHKARGLCLLELGRFAQAAVHLRRAGELLRHADGQVCVGMGRCCEALGDVGRALREYDRAVGCDPASAYAWFCRGRCKLRAGDGGGGAQDLGQVLRVDPLFVSRYVEAAAAEEEAGRPGAAVEMLGSLQDLPMAPEQRAWLRDRAARAVERQRAQSGAVLGGGG